MIVVDTSAWIELFRKTTHPTFFILVAWAWNTWLLLDSVGREDIQNAASLSVRKHFLSLFFALSLCSRFFFVSSPIYVSYAVTS